MNLILCIDKKGGMAFNKRRQTKDKKQRIHMLKMVNDSNLFINSYSIKLLQDEVEDLCPNCLIADDNYLSLAKDDDYVFCELDDVNEYMDRVNKIYLYRWNRLYLSDVRFNEEVLKDYKLDSREEFSGTSHDRITFEVYKK